MNDVDSWMEALLWPRMVAPALNDPPRSLSDAEMVALLVSGRLRDLDACARHMAVEEGLNGVVAGAVSDSHPVGTAFARWLVEFGRGASASTDSLVTMAREQTEPNRDAVCAILACVALATEERLAEAVAVLREAAGRAAGLRRSALLVQLSCRLHESGDPRATVEAAEQFLAERSAETLLDRDLRRIARFNRYNADSLGRGRELRDLQRLPTEDPSAAGSRYRFTGLKHLTDDISGLLFSPAARPGTRIWNWDDGWQQLLGAWLHEETRGDWAGVRASRRLLGLYPTIEMQLPFPPGWMHTSADVVDIDLIRRSGDHRLTSSVASRWWEEGPTEELVAALKTLSQRDWLPPMEQSNLGLLSSAGDLLEQEAADALVLRLISIVDGDDASRAFVPAYYVAPAMVEVLQAAGPNGHHAAAEALLRWANDPVAARPMTVVPTALRPQSLDRALRKALQALGAEAAASDDWEQRQLGVEVLLALKGRLSGPDTIQVVLARAWRATGSLVVAAGFLRAGGPSDPLHPDLVPFLLERIHEGDPHEGWVDARELLAVLAHDPRAAAELKRWLTDTDVSPREKYGVLEHLAVGEESASTTVIDQAVAQAIEVSSVPDLDDELYGSSAHVQAAAIAACARAGQLQPDVAMRWLVRMMGGPRHDRWAAAHILGALGNVLPHEGCLPYALVLMWDRDVEIASEAAQQMHAVLARTSSADSGADVRARVLHALVELSRRPGCLGALTGGRVLLALDEWDDDLARRLGTHQSGRVRAVAAAAARHNHS